MDKLMECPGEPGEPLKVRNRKMCINHPDKEAHAHLLCSSCYQMWLHKNNAKYHNDQAENRRRWHSENDKTKRNRECRRSYYLRNKELLCAKARDRWKNKTQEQKWGHHLQRRYGLKMGQYNEILQRQGGVCAICRRIPSRRLFVDHDHRTGYVRGLLCGDCNTLLGFIERLDRLTVENALRYCEGQSPVRIHPQHRQRVSYLDWIEEPKPEAIELPS